MKPEEVAKLQQDEERLEYLERRDAVLDIGVLLNSAEGQRFFKYLFKTLDVLCDPPIGMEGKPLHEYLGHLRAGNSIYKLACEADPAKAAIILAQLERERYERYYRQLATDESADTTTSDY